MLNEGLGSDIESEDEDEEDEEDDEGSTRSTSVATPGASGRALTARQAVLANVVDSSHVSLSASFTLSLDTILQPTCQMNPQIRARKSRSRK